MPASPALASPPWNRFAVVEHALVGGTTPRRAALLGAERADLRVERSQLRRVPWPRVIADVRDGHDHR